MTKEKLVDELRWLQQHHALGVVSDVYSRAADEIERLRAALREVYDFGETDLPHQERFYTFEAQIAGRALGLPVGRDEARRAVRPKFGDPCQCGKCEDCARRGVTDEPTDSPG